MTDLKKIQERAEKATPEPWAVSDTQDDGFCVPRVAYMMGTNAEANAAFIAHAREDIPMLLKALAEAEAKLGAVKELHIPHISTCYGYDCGECLCHCHRLDAILGGSSK